MLPIPKIVNRIRRGIHDTDEVTYTDEDILDEINNAVRFIRRTITDLRPELLAGDVITGILNAGENCIELDKRPLSLVYVRAGDEVVGQKLSMERDKSDLIYHNYNRVFHNNDIFIYTDTVDKQNKNAVYRTVRMQEISLNQLTGDLTEQGTPEFFTIKGDRQICLWYVPNKTTRYEVLAVDDIEELTMKDVSPLMTEFDDLIIKYACMVLQISNEYDVTQDNTVFSVIYQQIVSLLHIPPAGIQTDGYWDSPSRLVGYTRRRHGGVW